MIVSTKAIVISAIKYGENHLIVKCYTEKEGAKSYLLRGVLSSRKKQLKAAYFQPLTQLKIVANHKTNQTLHTIKEVEINNHYTSLSIDIYKQSIVLFLSEVLNYSIREEEENLPLYNYLESAFIWLDIHKNISNFHLVFLLNLTKYLGFYPELNNPDYNYFDLSEGNFTNQLPKFNFIKGGDLIEFNKLLGINFDTIEVVKFNSKSRQQVLSILIQYYELHLNGFRKPKSLEVLKALFH
ncbi:MAG: DNA repair protein RecO [Flavobacteriaceae bacterium]